jgi:8-oxo-dGTP pyrophosphatase MutT (NUDIX family)
MNSEGRFQLSQKLFLRRGEQMLILRDQASGVWDLPGGRVSASEFNDLAGALRRELLEELGDGLQIVVEPRPLLVSPLTVLESGIGVIGVAYEAWLRSGEVRLSAEHDAMEWVRVDTYDPQCHYVGSGLLPFVECYLAHVRSH